MTGERKGGPISLLLILFKECHRVMILITGWVLQVAGFVPNVEQTQLVQISMVTLYGLSPLICYTIGTILFSRFSLDARHQRIRSVISERQELNVVIAP